MAVTPKGYTQLANDGQMKGPEQINAAELFVENLIGENVATAANLPASGNWEGRHVLVTGAGDYVWTAGAWKATWLVPDTGWITPTLLNGWVPFGGAYRGPAYRRLGGVVYIKGLIKSGTAAPGTAIFTLPAGFRPSTYDVYPTWGNGGGNALEISPTGSVVVGDVAATSLRQSLTIAPFIAEQ